MSTTVAGAEVRRYLDAIRAHLNDLQDEDREELLEDLEEHLLEVAAEDDGTLEQRLGPASAYAEELRASAGLPSRDYAAAPGFVERLTRSKWVTEAAALLESPRVRSLRDFVREVQPGWWILRGYLAVVIVALSINGDNVRDNVPSPDLGGSHVFGTAFVPVAMFLSVLLGRRAKDERRIKLLSIAASLAVAIASLSIAAGWRAGSYGYAVVDDGSGYEGTTYLHHADGSTIANICPYSADGKLLSGVLLFDQAGRAIVNIAEEPEYGSYVPPIIKNVYPRASARGEVEPGVFGLVSCPASIAAQPRASGLPTSIPTGTP